MIPIMNVQRQYESIRQKLDEAVLEVLHSGQYILGKKVEEFEQSFADYCNTKFAVGVGNGTDAIVLTLRACGIGAGDEVITTAMSFFATAESIAAVGAIPVFVDCTKDTYLLDVTQIEQKITDKTKAIIPVHLYGQCADMDEIIRIAKKHNLKVIEDAAQAAGAEYKGRKAGSMGDAGCVSFFPTKNLGAAGDGGIVITDDENIYRRCRALRVHGSGLDGLFTYEQENNIKGYENKIDFNGNLPKYYNFVQGYNSRLDAVQAAILGEKLSFLDNWNKKRREIAAEYDRRISNPAITKPYISKDNLPIYYVYTISCKDRDGLRAYLKEKGVASGVYFPVPLHEQKVFEKLVYCHGDFPCAEFVAEHTLVLPMFPELTQEEIDKVVEVVNRWKG